MTRCNREKGSHGRGSVSRRASRRLSSLPLRRFSLSFSLVYLFFSRLSSPFGRSVMLAFLDPASLLVSWKLISLDEKGLRGKGKIRLFGGGEKKGSWTRWKGSFFLQTSVITIKFSTLCPYFHRINENE